MSGPRVVSVPEPTPPRVTRRMDAGDWQALVEWWGARFPESSLWMAFHEGERARDFETRLAARLLVGMDMCDCGRTCKRCRGDALLLRTLGVLKDADPGCATCGRSDVPLVKVSGNRFCGEGCLKRHPNTEGA